VRVVSGVRAEKLDDRGLHLSDGRVVEAGTVVWAAGVRAAHLVDGLGLELGSHRRIRVSPSLQVPGHPEVLAIGDLAEIPGGAHGALPMLAQVAIQGGRHAAGVIEALLAGSTPRPFSYRDLGTMATQGRNAAVAQVGALQLSGFIGWLAWLLVHIARIVGLRTRLLVLANWIAGYLLLDRPVRLIIGPSPDGGERA
jgi:NADH dehydrogenase